MFSVQAFRLQRIRTSETFPGIVVERTDARDSIAETFLARHHAAKLPVTESGRGCFGEQ